MDNHIQILNHTLNFLNRVTTTGVEESNNLVQSAVLIDKLLKGELMIVNTPKKAADKDSEESE